MIDELARRRERLQAAEPRAESGDTAKLYWLQIAEREREAARAAWRRLQSALVLSGSATGGGDAARALDEARAIAERLRAEHHATAASFDRLPDVWIGLRSVRNEHRVITGDHVAIHADTLIRMEAEIAKAISEMHDAKARLAEYHVSATSPIAPADPP